MNDDPRSPGLASPSPERAVTGLRDAAPHLVRDLQASFDATWDLRVNDDLVMTLAWGERTEAVQLGDPLKEAEWLQDDGWFEEGGLPTGKDLEELLDEVALEYLAAEVSEVLDLWGCSWPGCPVHGRPLGACGREWFCDGPPAHSLLIGAIADLSADREPPIPLDAGFDSVAIRVSPIRSREWRDETGTHWRLRGAGPVVDLKRLEHLLEDDTARVLLFDGLGAPANVPVEERAALSARMLPYLRGKVDRAATNDQTEFVIGEFKDPSRRSLVIIEEYC